MRILLLSSSFFISLTELPPPGSFTTAKYHYADNQEFLCERLRHYCPFCYNGTEWAGPLSSTIFLPYLCHLTPPTATLVLSLSLSLVHEKHPPRPPSPLKTLIFHLNNPLKNWARCCLFWERNKQWAMLQNAHEKKKNKKRVSGPHQIYTSSLVARDEMCYQQV